MGVGVEDVLAVKMLEHGMVPPVPNFEEVDPDLGVLNLSRGGNYPIAYALHLAGRLRFSDRDDLPAPRARRTGAGGRPLRYQHWLDAMSGYDRAELETVKRVLRVQSQDGPGRSPAPSLWRKGQGPSERVGCARRRRSRARPSGAIWKVADKLAGQGRHRPRAAGARS